MRPRFSRQAAAAGIALVMTATTAAAVMTTTAANAADDGFGARAEVRQSAETGAVNFVGTPAGKPLAPPQGITASSTPQAAARAFVSQHATEFGLGSRSTLKVAGTNVQATGNETVRVQQHLDGVEVLGGELAVQVDERNRVVSTAGEVLPETIAAPSVRPRISAAEAVRSARTYIARAEGVKADKIRTSYEGLRIFDSRLVGGPVMPGAHTVHAVEVSLSDHVRRQVFIEASIGAVLASFDEIHGAKTRRVCDAGNTARQQPCTSPVLTEGGSTAGLNADVVQAYNFSGATYDWFKNQFNRDSIDGRGMALVSTVRYCEPGQRCPYQNAFWDGRQMTYGQGFAVADDVVAHELSHGITEKTSGLFYYYQSGAINESISDVFGELVDLATSSSGDAASQRWRLGEALPAAAGRPDGAIRNMSNPNEFRHPARMNDPYYYRGKGDNGGVHLNSGVGNKAASLMTDGGTFNGQTVSGVGATKTAAFFYEANTGMLTSGSDYQDLARALRQSCKNLTGTKGITSSDCAQVDRALKATQMDVPRSNVKDQRTCAKVKKWTFSDGLEKGGKKWKKKRPWFAPGNPNNLSFNATYASSGKKNIWGFDRPGNWFPNSRKGKARDYSIRTKKKVKVPKHKSSFLRFRHAYMFDHDYKGRNFDGGRVEYSRNGKKWFDLMKGKYPNRVNARGSKFAKKKAFAGESGGYVTTVKKFPKKVRGKKVFIRFRIATDKTPDVYHLGWFIDDIGVGRCKK